MKSELGQVRKWLLTHALAGREAVQVNVARTDARAVRAE